MCEVRSLQCNISEKEDFDWAAFGIAGASAKVLVLSEISYVIHGVLISPQKKKTMYNFL